MGNAFRDNQYSLIPQDGMVHDQPKLNETAGAHKLAFTVVFGGAEGPYGLLEFVDSATLFLYPSFSGTGGTCKQSAMYHSDCTHNRPKCCQHSPELNLETPHVPKRINHKRIMKP